MEDDFLDSALPVDDASYGGAYDYAPASYGQEAVPVSGSAQTAQDYDNPFEGLAQAIGAGLQGLQEMFGLGGPAAIPGASGTNMRGAEAMYRGAGAYSGQEMQAIRKSVDPEDKLTEGVANLAGLINAYETFSARGDAGSAKKMAASIIQYSQQRSISLGGLALEAIKDGNYSDGAKALVQAFNVIPNGQQVSIENGVGVIKDMKTGETVKELKLTPQVMIAAAKKLASGEDYYNMLMDTASGKQPGQSHGLSAEEENARYEAAEAAHKPVDMRGMDVNQSRAAREYNRGLRFDIRREDQEKRTQEALTLKEKAAADKAAADEAKAAKKAADDEKKANDRETAQRREKEIDLVNKLDDYGLIGKSKPDPLDEEATPVKLPPRQQLEDIRDVTKYILRNNDLYGGQALRYGQQITSPKQNVKLQETEGGGTITMPDGETLNLPGRAFSHVKRIREGFTASPPAEEKAAPRKRSAIDVLMGRD